MTFNELLKDLNVLPATLNTLFISSGMTGLDHLPSKSEELPDDQTALLKKYCLFRMLGYSQEDTRTLPGNFKDSITAHINSIIKDKNNNTQAAIVLSNIKRNEEDFEKMVPEQYITQIKELRAKGGLFYDVNSGILDGYSDFWNRNDKKHSEVNEKWTTVSSGQIYNAEDVWKRNHPSSAGDSSAENKSSSEQGSTESDEFVRRNSTDYYGSYTSGTFTDRYGRPRPVSGYAGEGTNSEGVSICPHPFRRYLARTLDQMIVALPLDMFFALVLKIDLTTSYMLDAASLILSFFLTCLLEPFALAFLGTTPGKFIMGIKITARGEERKLTLKEAAMRTIGLIRYGSGFMIPFYSLICEYRSLVKCRFGQVMEWDKGCDISLTSRSIFRIVAIFFALTLTVNCESLISYQAMIPSNRGNITVEQFYENCREFMAYRNIVGDPTELGYKFTTNSSGYITSVTYAVDSSESEVYPSSLITELAFFAYAAVTDGSNGFSLIRSDSLTSALAPYYSFSSLYLDVKVTNEIETKGYTVIQTMQNMVYKANSETPSFHQVFTLSKSIQ